MIQPGRAPSAAEFVVDAFAYSLLNAGVFSWAILLTSRELTAENPNYVTLGLLGLLVCVIGPTLWPVAFRTLQRFGARRKWLMGAHRFAWDDFFGRNEPCWVIVHLSDGRMIGGYFGEESYATVEPESGHLYLEELWHLEDGRFAEPIPDSKGALFRPSDYHWIELFEDDLEPAEGKPGG